MTKKLTQVKRALTEKYERLAKVASSKVKQKQYLYKAEMYRHQVEQLLRQ
jgi:hypothetical protein